METPTPSGGAGDAPAVDATTATTTPAATDAVATTTTAPVSNGTDGTSTTNATDAATDTTATGTEAAPDTRPWWQKVFGEDGKYVKGWQEHLPKELEAFKNLAATVDSPEGMFKSWKDSKTAAMSKGYIKPITEKSTPEEIADYREKMGIPAEPYKLTPPEKLPDGMAWDEEKAARVGKWAQEANLTPDQVPKAMEMHLQLLAEDIKAVREAQESAMAAQLAQEAENLKLMYGGNQDRVVLAAQRAAMWGNVPAAALDPKSPNFLGIPMLQYFHKVSEMLGESRLPSTAVVANMDELAQARDIQTNTANPEHKAFMEGNQAVAQKVMKLIADGLKRKGGQ